MNPVGTLGNRARLVALQRPDEVPLDTAAPQGLALGNKLLNIVFAKGALTAAQCLAHMPDRPCLAHGQQRDGTRRPSASACGGLKACFHGLQVVCY